MLKQISRSDLAKLPAQHEAVVDATPGIDHWCSGPDWVLSVAAGFAPDVPTLLLAGREGLATLAYYRSESGTVVSSLEPLWGFASPFAGTDFEALGGAVASHLMSEDSEDWDQVYVPGLPNADHPVTKLVASGLTPLGPIRLAPGIIRQVADLTGGYEEWLGRRSPKFRRNLRRSARHAEQIGLTMVDVSGEESLIDRLLAIEHRSWKGHEESGITSEEMATTYSIMIDRLQRNDRLHAHIAQLDGTDVGYILGGVRKQRYRGLQISYRKDLDGTDLAPLSIGNLLQQHQIQLLCQEETADTYDMGMDFDYKRRWADRAEPSFALVINRRPTSATV